MNKRTVKTQFLFFSLFFYFLCFFFSFPLRIAEQDVLLLVFLFLFFYFLLFLFLFFLSFSLSFSSPSFFLFFFSFSFLPYTRVALLVFDQLGALNAANLIVEIWKARKPPVLILVFLLLLGDAQTSINSCHDPFFYLGRKLGALGEFSVQVVYMMDLTQPEMSSSGWVSCSGCWLLAQTLLGGLFLTIWSGFHQVYKQHKRPGSPSRSCCVHTEMEL